MVSENVSGGFPVPDHIAAQLREMWITDAIAFACGVRIVTATCEVESLEYT